MGEVTPESGDSVCSQLSLISRRNLNYSKLDQRCNALAEDEIEDTQFGII